MTFHDPFATLRQQFAAARRDRARHRDIAATLGVSEGELIAAHAGRCGAAESPLAARPLHGPWGELIGALEPLGEVMALTRNESCVHGRRRCCCWASARACRRR